LLFAVAPWRIKYSQQVSGAGQGGMGGSG
jgi:hypothetical protein